MYRVDGESSGFRDVLGESLTIGSIVKYIINGVNNLGKIVNSEDKDWIINEVTKQRMILSDYTVANHQVLKV